MIRIEEITLREIRLPLKEPFRISSGLCTERRIMLLHLRDADGIEVWSECVAGEAPNYTSETIDTAWFAITEYVAPRVLGVNYAQPSDVHPALELNFRGHNMAKAAIEMGSWGLAAEREKTSLSKFIGGTRDRHRDGDLDRHSERPRRTGRASGARDQGGVSQDQDEDRAGPRCRVRARGSEGVP